MKFKRLPQKDLEALEKDFIQFLASHSITANDWVKMKESELEKAEELIDIFSDMVYSKAMTNIRYVDKRTSQKMIVCYLKDEEIEMLGIEVDNKDLDLTSPRTLAELAKGEFKDKVTIFKDTKEYKKDRSEEVFDMLENGYYVVDSQLFNLMRHLYSA